MQPLGKALQWALQHQVQGQLWELLKPWGKVARAAKSTLKPHDDLERALDELKKIEDEQKAGMRAMSIGEAMDLRFGSVQPRRGGAFVDNWASADGVSVLISGSKTDQYNLGCVRTHGRAGGLLCPVMAARMWTAIPHARTDRIGYRPAFSKSKTESE